MPLSARLSVAGLIVSGATASLFAKIVYEVTGIGVDGQEQFFHKPWFMTSVMFAGMSFCLPLSYWQEAAMKKKRGKDELEPLLPGADVPNSADGWREALLMAIPSFFDLVATMLMNVGLLSVTASVYQMMRGSEMLFAAVFAVLILKRTLNSYHYLGILCCAVGISFVGMSSIFSGEGSSTHKVSTEQMLLGMGLIVASQAVQAAQLTFEDFFMADLSMLPLKIVGFEGVFGVLFMALILLPVAYFLPGPEGIGLHEDSLDTLAMIRSSPALQTVLFVNMLALLGCNACGMMVTGHLGAVFRTVLETMRTLFVWLLGLLLFYTPLGMGKLGESWSNWSYLQALGFAILVAGTLVYGRGDVVRATQGLSAAVTAAGSATDALPSGIGGGAVEAGRASAPIAAPAALPHSVPILATSFKSTMSMLSASYSRSFTPS